MNEQSPQQPEPSDPDEVATFHPVAEAVEEFVARIRSLKDIFPDLMSRAEESRDQARSHYLGAMREDDDGALLSDGDSDLPLAVSTRSLQPHEMPATRYVDFVVAKRRRHGSRNAVRDVPQALLLALVSHYDAFIADLIRAGYQIQPAMRRQINCQLGYDELDDLETIQSAKELMIEKVIESVIRDGRSDQLKWFERNFSVSTTSLNPEVDDLLELAERRNLIAHNGARVTNRYCLLTGAETWGTQPGEYLSVDSDYFDQAYATLYAVGVKLAHLAWRQLRADELALADHTLAHEGYELLVFGEYDLASRVFEFACSLNASNEFEHRRYVINWAQSRKWLGDEEGCSSVLASEDWTASGAAFLLARSVLSDNWPEAERLMRIVAANSDIPQAAFDNWPLFQEFRKRPEFRSVYVDHYPDGSGS